MFNHFGLLLEVLRMGIARLSEEFGVELDGITEAEIEQDTRDVFSVQTGHYRAWVSTFRGEPVCYYVDDMDVPWA